MVLMLFVVLTGCDTFADAQARIAQAQELIAAQNHQGALIKLRNALKSEPQNLQARVLLVEVLLHLGDASGAEKELRRAMQNGAPVAEIADLLARVRLETGQADILVTQLASGELPLAEPARSLYRGQAFLQLQDNKAAAESFRAVLASDPDSVAARIGLAQAAAAQGDADTALAELNRAVQKDEAAEAWLVRGVLQAQRGEFEAAERDLRAAREHAQGKLPAAKQMQLLAALIETRLARNDLTGAREIGEELDSLALGTPLARVLAARIALAGQDYSAAVADLQRLVGEMPDFVSARFLLGAAVLAQGDLNQAEMQLAQTVQRAPENLEARKLLAQVRLRLSRPDAAMQALLSAQQSDAADSQLEALMGLAQMQLGDATAGIAHLERSVSGRPENAELKLELARAYLRAGQSDKAVDLLNTVDHSPSDARRESLLLIALRSAKGANAARAAVDQMLKEHPGNVPILGLAAEFLARQREFDRARALIEKPTAAAPRDAAPLMSWARIEMTAGETQAAQRKLEQAAALEPDNEITQLGLAGLAVLQRDVPGALSRLNEFRVSHKTALRSRLMLASLYGRDKRNKEADEVLAEVLQVAGSRADVVNAVGLSYLDAGRYSEALARFREAADRDRSNATYWFNLARAQLALGHAGPGREALGKAIALRPDWIAPAAAMAMLDVKEGRADDALARVEQLKKNSPVDPAVLVLDGDLNSALERHAAAAAAYEAAARIRPDAALAIKAYRSRRSGSLPDAAGPLKKWLEREPEDVAVRSLLAESWQASGRRDLATVEYEKIVRLAPKHAAALNNLAWLYHLAGNPDAEATARRAFELAPQVAAIADTYGWILVQRGQPERGRDILRQVAASPDVDPEIDYHYAVALARSGAIDEARSRLAALLERSTDFPSRSEARQLLARLAAG